MRSVKLGKTMMAKVTIATSDDAKIPNPAKPSRDVTRLEPQIREHGRPQSEKHQSNEISRVVRAYERIRQRLQLLRVK
ncbi:MAG: hypothetical protein WA757_18890, partial [Candidatus Acidiferrales bacterium]